MTTTSTLTRLAPTQVALEFSITRQELAAAEERAFRKLVKNVRLPGFRPGKIPRKIFEQTYGAETVTNQAVDEVVPEVYAKAIREHDLEPVERPKLEILEEADGRPTRLKATVEVRPTIELRKYKGLLVSRPPVAVTDAEIEHSLEALAKERATLVPVDRPARLGDVVTIDYDGSVDGEPFEGGQGRGEVTELAEGRFVPGFAAGIVGLSAGETKNVEIRVPDDYGAAALAGKEAVFAIALHDVKEFELPAVDDDFAKNLSGAQSVDELRADLRRRLEVVAQSRGRRAVGNAVMEQLLSTHDFPLPPSMIENEIDRHRRGRRGRDHETRNELRRVFETKRKERRRAACFVPPGGGVARKSRPFDRTDRQDRTDRGDAGRHRPGARSLIAAVRPTRRSHASGVRQ